MKILFNIGSCDPLESGEDIIINRIKSKSGFIEAVISSKESGYDNYNIVIVRLVPFNDQFDKNKNIVFAVKSNEMISVHWSGDDCLLINFNERFFIYKRVRIWKNVTIKYNNEY